MSQHFLADKRFVFTFIAVRKLWGEDSEGVDIVSTEDEIDFTDSLMRTANEKGLIVSGNQYLTIPFSAMCYAAKSDCLAFDWDGTVVKCTLYTKLENNRVGSIADGKLDIKDHLIASWTSMDLQEKCKSCKILTICYNRLCPLGTISDDYCARHVAMYENALKSLVAS